MEKEYWVIDATMGVRDGAFCFCPVEMDDDGNIKSIITGVNFVGAPPERATVIAIVHADGQGAVEEFYRENEIEIRKFLGPKP